MKTCGTCKIDKELKDFFKNKASKDGFRSNCKACGAAYKKVYYKINKGTVLEKRKEYHEKNKESINRKKRVYYIDNKERVKARQKAYRGANPEKQRLLSKEWSLNNRALKNEHRAKRRAAKINATPPWLTEEHRKAMRDIYKRSELLSRLTGVMHHVDHIEPLQGKNCCGLHVPWNLQILTATENWEKGNKLDA